MPCHACIALVIEPGPDALRFDAADGRHHAQRRGLRGVRARVWLPHATGPEQADVRP
jgi:hypothetical protein